MNKKVKIKVPPRTNIRRYYLRDKKSVRFSTIQVALPFDTYVQNNIIPNLNLGVRNKQKKTEIVKQILAHAFLSYQAGKVLADSRDTGSKANVRIPIYDELVVKKYLVKCLGSESSGMVTRYSLSKRFTKEVFQFSYDEIINLNLAPQTTTSRPSNLGPVILRDINKTAIPFPKVGTKIAHKIKLLENNILKLNEANLRCHTWIYDVLDKDNNKIAVNQVNPCVKAIFTADFEHGGRLYSWGANGYQSLAKAERRTILVDSKPIAELDYSGYHPRRLYHKEKFDCKGDIYQPEEILPELYEDCFSDNLRQIGRNYVKQVTNIILNASNKSSACRCAGHIFREDKTGFLSEIIYKICKTRPKEIVNRIEQLHQPISKYFYNNTGLKLQTEDLWLILDILNSFHVKGKPALSLHDAIICKRSDVLLAKQLMKELYLKHFGFYPVLKREY